MSHIFFVVRFAADIAKNSKFTLKRFILQNIPFIR